jgi:transcriptional regulator with XRE-family HTH domain
MAKEKLKVDEMLVVTLEGMGRDGMTDEQIAGELGISARSLYSYLKRYPELKEALANSKKKNDYKIENALLKRALGCKVRKIYKDVNPEGETVITKIVETEEPPDVTACIRWLCNRRPDKWKLNPTPEPDSDGIGDTITEFWHRLNNSWKGSDDNK